MANGAEAEPDVRWPWWSIDGEELMKLLQRCHNGEEPWLVYTEAYASSKVERPEADGG